MDFFLQINFPPMRAIEFIRDHVTFKLPYDFSYQMKTPYGQPKAVNLLLLVESFHNFLKKSITIFGQKLAIPAIVHCKFGVESRL